jgi:hypothetical protein
LKNAGLVHARSPRPNENFLILGDDGTIRAAFGTWKLFVYLHLIKAPWVYGEPPEIPQGMNPDPGNYSIDQVAPVETEETLLQTLPKLGYGLEDARAMRDLARGKHELQAWRARNPMALEHDKNPAVITKPSFCFRTEGGKLTSGSDWTNDQKRQAVREGRTFDLSTVHAADADTSGYLKDLQGREARDPNGKLIPIAGLIVQVIADAVPPSDKYQPFEAKIGGEYRGVQVIEIDGRLVTSDADPQFIMTKRKNGPYDYDAVVHTEGELEREVNSAVNRELARHGPNDTYWTWQKGVQQ